jgi:hypothetical protein
MTGVVLIAAGYAALVVQFGWPAVVAVVLHLGAMALVRR